MSDLAPGEFDVSGVSNKRVSWSHLAIPVLDVEKTIAFFQKYAQMKVIKRRENPVNVWMADGIRPFQLALLASDPVDIADSKRSGPTDYHNSKLAHPIVKSAHIGFTCRSCSEVKRIAEMAKEDGILENGPCEEGWPGGYTAYVSDPNGHSIEFSYNQEAGYNAVFDPVCDLDTLRNTYEDGRELWEE